MRRGATAPVPQIALDSVRMRLSGYELDPYIKDAFQRRKLLRTVPTFVTAHTFCASRDTRVSYGWCLLIQGYFCAV